jgi:hypothetical protein
VVLTLDTTDEVTAGAMRADANDVRVVRHAATTQELDRRILAFNTTSTRLWFKTQASIDGTDQTYYLYYGNLAALAAPSHWADNMGAAAVPSGVYLAADDFEGDPIDSMPSGWAGSARYKVELDGSNRVLGVTGIDGPADYLFAGDYAWTDYVLEARMAVLLTSGTYCGLWARAESATNFDTLFYGLASNSSLASYRCTIASADATALSSSSMLDSWSISAAGTAWHDYQIRVRGQNAAYFYDGAQVGTDTLPAGQMTQGRIGVCAGYPATRALWDDFVVRKYVSPEPTVAAGSPEPFCL